MFIFLYISSIFYHFSEFISYIIVPINMQTLPTIIHPKYGCTKETHFTKNTTVTIKPIINNKVPNIFLFDFILLLILLFCGAIANFFSSCFYLRDDILNGLCWIYHRNLFEYGYLCF